MKFGIKWFVSFLMVDHAAAFTKSLERNRCRPFSIEILRADYLKNLEYNRGDDGTNGSTNSNDYYATGFNEPLPPSQFPGPAINDGTGGYDTGTTYEMPTSPVSSPSSGSQDYSYLQDWNVQSAGQPDTSSSLNQMSAWPRSTPEPAPTSPPNAPAYGDALGGSDDMDSLFFLEKRTNSQQPSPTSNNNEIDPFSGFPVSSYNSASASPPDSDAWYQDMAQLKGSVAQLSRTLSALSSQLASVVSAQTSPSSAVPSMAQVEEMIKRQYEQVVVTQNGVSKRLEASISDLRAALSRQDQSIQTMSNKAQEQGREMSNLGQSVSAMESKVQASQASREDMERRLMALEARLSEQQLELKTASTRTDPRVMALEAKLQEQAELLKQATTNPEARMYALETKIAQLQQELSVASISAEPRVAALEKQWQEQQSRWETAQTQQPDPRIATLEAKMKAQEEQIREATAAISDARVAALRLKLTEQQEQLEAANRARKIFSGPSQSFPGMSSSSPSSTSSAPSTTDPTPALFSNPFISSSEKDNKQAGEVQETEKDKDNKKGKSKWLPWGQSWKTSKPKEPERDGAFAAAPSPPPKPLTPEQPSPPAGSFPSPTGSSFPWNNQNNASPPAFGSYQNSLNGNGSGANGQYSTAPPQSGPVGAFTGNAFGRGKGITIETGPEQKPSAPSVPAASVPPSSPPSAGESPPSGVNGAFRGQAFGRGKGITIETAPAQSPQSPPVPTSPAFSGFGNPLSGRETPPPVVPSDQDQWDPDRPNPDAVKRPLFEYPKSLSRNTERESPRRPPKIASDQDRWDPERPNPDAVKRPLIEKRRTRSPSPSRLQRSPLDAPLKVGQPKASTSDQDQWSAGPYKRGDGKDTPVSTADAAAEGLPPNHGVASDQAYWDLNASNPDAMNKQSGTAYNRGVRPQQTGRPSGAKGVTSDQGRWDSAAQIKRDNGDLRPGAGKQRPAVSQARNPGGPPQKSQILSAYFEWCKTYGKEPDETRFEQFSRNYSRMEAVARQTGQFPAMNAFSDFSEDEFKRMNSN